MRTFYLIITKHKDIFALIISIVLSLIMLSNGESDNLRLLRSKANRILTRIYTPITWIRTMSLIEEEASLLREKNLQLSFQLESMKHLFDENIRLKQLLNFKRESKLNIYPARVSNMGASPHLSSSLSIDIGSNLGVSINDPVMTPSAVSYTHLTLPTILLV